MAGVLDNMKDQYGDKMDSMKARYEELRNKEQAGELDDKGRAELNELKSKFDK